MFEQWIAREEQNTDHWCIFQKSIMLPQKHCRYYKWLGKHNQTGLCQWWEWIPLLLNQPAGAIGVFAHRQAEMVWPRWTENCQCLRVFRIIPLFSRRSGEGRQVGRRHNIIECFSPCWKKDISNLGKEVNTLAYYRTDWSQALWVKQNPCPFYP